MQLTREQFEQIAPLLPRQRGNVRLDNFDAVNAILYVAANGCKWRALPSHYEPIPDRNRCSLNEALLQTSSAGRSAAEPSH